MATENRNNFVTFDTGYQGKSSLPIDSKSKPVEIKLYPSDISRTVKLFPNKEEIAAGHFLMPVLDENGKKIPDGKGVTEKGATYDKYKMEPLTDAAGNIVPVEKDGNGRAKPIVFSGSLINPNPEGRTRLGHFLASRAYVDVTIPNADPNDLTRKANISVKRNFIKSDKDGIVLSLYESNYPDGILINKPEYAYHTENNKAIKVEPEMHEYTNKKGEISKKLMVPVGYDKDGEAVWNDNGKIPCVKSDKTDKIAALQAKGIEFKTYETSIQYKYPDIKKEDATIENGHRISLADLADKFNSRMDTQIEAQEQADLQAGNEKDDAQLGA